MVFLLCLSAVSIIAVSGCIRTNHDTTYDLDDDVLKLVEAMRRVDRQRFCLTQVEGDLKAQVIRSDSPTRGYDLLLHLYGQQVSRYVTFVWEEGHYIWIGEQETHFSGRTYDSVDGELPEEITIAYYDRRIEGAIPGLIITYSGDNKQIAPWPTCEQALDYIQAWNSDSLAP